MLKEWKRKIPKKQCTLFHPWLQKRIDRKSFGLTRGPILLERLKTFVLQRGYKVTLLWVRLRRLLLNKQHDHWKKFFTVTWRFLDTKYIHKVLQFITTLNSRRNSSIDMRPNTVKNCDFMSILYSRPLREYKKPTLKFGDRVRTSK